MPIDSTLKLVLLTKKSWFSDFIKVISVKATKWLNTKFEDYLTPNTLFGNKFESYLNENIKVEKTKQENAYEQVIKATELGFNN